MRARQYLGSVLEAAFVIYAGGYMLLYGAGKLLGWQFKQNPQPLDVNASGFALMWRFFGYSPAYTFIIGCIQVLGALLLFWRKTRLAGCLLLLTVMINVVLMDIFYGVVRGALSIAINVCLCLLAILWLHRSTLVAATQQLLSPAPAALVQLPFLKRLALVAVAGLLVLILETVIRILL